MVTQGKMATLKETAEQLHITSRTLSTWKKEGRIPANTWCQVGRRILFNPARLSAWLEQECESSEAAR